jgi:hypothetical protein
MNKATNPRSVFRGRWRGGAAPNVQATIVGVVAGLLRTVTVDGQELRGAPSDFELEGGQTGEEILSLILPPPTTDALFKGAVRNSIASACSIAIRGRCETRAWDAQNQYLVDDGMGNVAIVRFVGCECVCAAQDHDPYRSVSLRTLLERLPPHLHDSLMELCKLPLLVSVPELPNPITAVFWSSNNVISSGEPWFQTYTYGAETLELEFLSELEWLDAARGYFSLTDDVLSFVVHLARRRDSPTSRIRLTRDELSRLVPNDSRFRDDALAELMGGETVVLS